MSRERVDSLTMGTRRLAGKTAVITGTSSGIGRAIAVAYHREGANVVCSDVQETHRQDAEQTPTHELIKNDGGNAIFVRTDVTRAEDVKSLVKEAVKQFGRVDIFVNNAGIALEPDNPTPVWDTPETTWDRTFAINSRGVFLGCKYASSQMMKQEPQSNGDRGWIINMASVFGLRGTTEFTSYVSSKHAVVGLTKTAALDCAPHRIHVNAICPGYSVTPLTSKLFEDDKVTELVKQRHPFRGLGMAEDIAQLAVFLASEQNTWMTGAAVPIDGGYTAL